jgi:hypothetical protein
MVHLSLECADKHELATSYINIPTKGYRPVPEMDSNILPTDEVVVLEWDRFNALGVYHGAAIGVDRHRHGSAEECASQKQRGAL